MAVKSLVGFLLYLYTAKKHWVQAGVLISHWLGNTTLAVFVEIQSSFLINLWCKSALSIRIEVLLLILTFLPVDSILVEVFVVDWRLWYALFSQHIVLHFFLICQVEECIVFTDIVWAILNNTVTDLVFGKDISQYLIGILLLIDDTGWNSV